MGKLQASVPRDTMIPELSPCARARALPYCPTVTPPLFATYFQEKEGGGVTTRTCAFTSQLSPPIPRIRVLCSAVEDENSFDRHAVAVLKDEELLATYMLQNIAGSLATGLRPPAATAG